MTCGAICVCCGEKVNTCHYCWWYYYQRIFFFLLNKTERDKKDWCPSHVYLSCFEDLCLLEEKIKSINYYIQMGFQCLYTI